MIIVEFLANNAIWCIIGAVVFVMAIIGYIAENSVLGQNVLNHKKTKVEKNKKQKEKKPETFEEAKQQLKDSGVTNIYNNGQSSDATIFSEESSSNGDLEPNMQTPTLEVQENVQTNEENNVVDDAWSNNINTDNLVPQNVSEQNPNEWLDNPIATDNQVGIDNSNEYNLSEVPVDNLQSSGENGDALYDMPDIAGAEPIAGISNFSNIEILNVDDEQELNSEENITEVSNEVSNNEVLAESNTSVDDEDIWK